ncbi:MAG: DMT family transporter [Phycisphaeraceae bacterium]|nr:DMT family transporter [Phycisphaeraceae bacterium]
MSHPPAHDGPSGGRALGVLTVVMTLVGWSSVPLFLRHFSHSIDAWTSNGWRYGAAAVFWLPWLIVAMRAGLTAGVFRSAMVPTLFNAAGQAAFTSAHYLIDPGLLTFGLRVQIVFVMVGAAVMFPAERRVVRSGWFVAGLALLLVGTVATIITDDQFGQRNNALGVGLAMIAGVFFAAYALSVRRFMSRYPAVLSFSVISQFTAAIMVALMLVLGDRAGATAITRLDGANFAMLIASALIGIALGHVFYYLAIQRLGVAVSSGVIQLQPFLVGVGAAILLNEPLLPAQWLGGTCAVLGAAIILYAQARLTRRGPRASSSPKAGGSAAEPPEVREARA